ncbi:hypothetical protein [Syntrophaceticus schinkii]
MFEKRGVFRLEQEINKIKESVQQKLKAAGNKEELQELRVKYLGKKGLLTKVLREMGKVPKELRPQIGQMANEVRQLLEGELDNRLAVLREKEKEMKLAEDAIDVTFRGGL